MIKKPANLKRIIIVAAVIAVLVASLGVAVFSVSFSVKSSSGDRIIDIDEASKLDNVDYILVLGAGLRSDGSPSDMLSDRLRVGISLFEKGASDKILMSGDNSGERYNEVAAMRLFAVENGVPSENIVLDGKGYSTYESVFNVVKEYGAEKVIIVTQQYHLYRALYIADSLGLDAYGVHADLRPYRGQSYRNLREHVARFKDFILTIIEDKD